MFDPSQIEKLARRLGEALPPQVHQLREDLEKNFKAILQGFFSELDLVSREEFEVQKKVLLRTREKLERLEKRVEALERALKERSESDSTEG